MSITHGDQPARPWCWGRTEVYDGEHKDCRACGFQSSCRNEVVRATLNRQSQVIQTPTYNPQPQFAPQSYVAPSQVPVVRYPQPAPAPAPSYQVPVRMPAPVPAPQYAQQQYAQPQVQMIPGMMVDWYGRIQDPMHFAVLSAPPPFRPQMEGETFFERVGKNIALDLGAVVFSHFLLAVRQMILPPQPHKPPEKVVNP